jgi:hypothetical protein
MIGGQRLQDGQIVDMPNEVRIIVGRLTDTIGNTPNQRTHFVDGILHRVNAGNDWYLRACLRQFCNEGRYREEQWWKGLRGQGNFDL